MKLIKYGFALAIAVCAITSVSMAQTVAFLGGGSPSIFVQLGQAAVIHQDSLTGLNTACIWTQNVNPGGTISALDTRNPGTISETGSVWVVWGPGPNGCADPINPSTIYMYTSLESTLALRCYFEVDSSDLKPGCLQIFGATQGAGHDLLGLPGPYASPTANLMLDTAIPASVIAALNGQHWFVAATEIRPEDAKFATFRALQPCGATVYRQPFDQILRQTYGLGYTNTSSITSDFAFGGNPYHVRDFNISGNDPLSNGVVRNYGVSTVGAQAIIVAVGPSSGGIYAANDIPGFVAANFFSGVLGRASDLLGSTGTNIAPWAVSALIREPLSGIYNAFEYGAINNSQFHTSQDIGNCAPGSAPGDPLHIVSANGAGLEGGTVQAFRRRVIGTDDMRVQLQNANEPDERIGYFYWSYRNVSLNNVKYLTFNGVDPIQDNYSNGTLPSSTGPGDPCPNQQLHLTCSAVTFKGLNSGDYPLWVALRIVSQSPTPASVTALISAAQTLPSTLFDFVPLTALKVWRSHYSMPGIGVNGAANGSSISTASDLCNPAGGALTEQGGDAGGAIILKQANADFCSDFGNNSGLINKVE